MKTINVLSLVFSKSNMLSIVCILILLICFPKSFAKKPLTFTDVEKEFHFAKPLSEQSQKLILKQFGTVLNYHDSIVVRTNRKDKGFILSARPISADSVECRLFHITDEEVKRKGRVAVEDSISILINAGSKK